MQSRIIAMLAPQGCRQATLLVRRADGQFALTSIDARIAHASRVAAAYSGARAAGAPSPAATAS